MCKGNPDITILAHHVKAIVRRIEGMPTGEYTFDNEGFASEKMTYFSWQRVGYPAVFFYMTDYEMCKFLVQVCDEWLECKKRLPKLHMPDFAFDYDKEKRRGKRV